MKTLVLEFEWFSEKIQDNIATRANLLKEFGAGLKRPYADTLKESDYPNMKELRFNVDKEVWRVAYAFDPERKAILLVGGDKRGQNQKTFYKNLIKMADSRFEQHLNNLEKGQ